MRSRRATTSCGILQYVRPLGRIKMAVVHPCDAVSLSAALDARAAGLIEPVLIGPRARIEAVAQKSDLNIDGIAIEDVPHSHAAAARAVELAVKGEVEALMKGSLHTDELMAAVVASPLRTKRRMSHCFLMQTPAYPRPFIITDAAINIAPTLSEKADIVRNAVDLAHAFGIARPRVAILAAVETVNPDMPATLDAAALCKMADRGQIPGAIVDGPLAFDNAVSAAAARTKGIVSEVAGAADILVVPDLESGNMLAKQLMYLGGAASAGIVVGARVPIVLTSRADSREARIASCAVALVAARRGAHGAANVGPADFHRPGGRRCASLRQRWSFSHERRPADPHRSRPCPGNGSATLDAASEPILVLNCGSSSIKFAVFDADALPLPRTPLWAGKVDGIGAAQPVPGRGRRRAGAARPGRRAALPRRPAGGARGVQRRAGGRLPAVVAHRVVHGGSKYTAPGAHRPPSAGRAQGPHPAGAAAPALRAAGHRGAAGRSCPRCPGGLLRHRLPPHAAAGGADAAVAPCDVGARHPALRLSRPVLRIHVDRPGRTPWRCTRRDARSSPTWAAAPACARWRACKAWPRRWAFPRSTA